ncbi:MAG: ORF6N domain-containing protein [Nitrospirae bacterium]|nr:ORF6N domain-containing protein [Nitrospirota bacterium]MBF0540538.1 ORF6N domain-containing protein [Nitrospirota bacterium]
MNQETKDLIPQERIEGKIFVIRGKKLIIDRDIAELYEVETKVLNQAVKRNIDRFPEDFKFQRTKEELNNWKSQFVTSNKEKMGLRKAPFAFTEHGVTMLSSVLNSQRAITINIQIIRTFIKLREIAITYKDLSQRIDDMEQKYDHQFKIVFDTLRGLLEVPKIQSKEIEGFKTK